MASRGVTEEDRKEATRLTLEAVRFTPEDLDRAVEQFDVDHLGALAVSVEICRAFHGLGRVGPGRAGLIQVGLTQPVIFRNTSSWPERTRPVILFLNLLLAA